jgi:membrane protein required for beta-lactamase induction
MRLIAILISLWANRYPEWLDRWRRSDLLFAYADWLRLRVLGSRGWQGAAGVFAFILPPVLLVILLQWWFGWLLGLVLGVAALLFAHGPARVDDDLAEFLGGWEQEDLERARRAVHGLSGHAEVPLEPSALPEEAVRGLFWQSYERLLGPIFWFVLLGPWGAVLFRLAAIAKEYNDNRQEPEEGFGSAVGALLYVLNWIPVRLAALAFGLAGSFVHAMEGWRDAAGARSGDNRYLLESSALGALNTPLTIIAADEVRAAAREARSLITRGVLCWLAVIALITITGQLAD